MGSPGGEDRVKVVLLEESAWDDAEARLRAFRVEAMKLVPVEAATSSSSSESLEKDQAGAVAPSSKRDTRRPIATRAIIPTYENRSL